MAGRAGGSRSRRDGPRQPDADRRVQELAERYDTPLPQLTDEVAELAAQVDGHLKKMGALWK